MACPTNQRANWKGIYRRCFKRPLDFILSSTALIVLSPVLFVVAILVRLKLGTPVLFRQDRPGLNEKIFTMYKFRTMTDEKDANGELLPDECRLTSFGRFLRSTSLDELPELFNIVKGDMSIVGPRPLLVQYLPLYNDYQRRRHEVRPGLTGLAQVSGRNAISWEDKFNLDVTYVESVSFITDVDLILKTVSRVLSREGISSETAETMELFLGSPEGGADTQVNDIVIVGAGGFGREVAWLIEDMNRVNFEWNLLGFVDDVIAAGITVLEKYTVLGDTQWLRTQKLHVVNAIGNPTVRKQVTSFLAGSANSYPVLKHPSVICSDRVHIGEGSIICAGSIITVDVTVGAHVIVNLACTIGHDAIIEDYSVILPGVNISGAARIGSCVSLGTGAAVLPGITVGDNSVVGAGAVVVRHLPGNCTAVGVPAKPIKLHQGL